MIKDDFRQGQHREELLELKERVMGRVAPDAADGLSEAEFLELEIRETAHRRKACSLPLIVIGGLMAIFSPGAANLLTRSFAFVFGSLMAGLGIWLLWKYTKRVRSLRIRLEALDSSETDARHR